MTTGKYTVVLVTIDTKPVTVGVGTITFPIENGKVTDNENIRIGCQMTGNQQYYKSAFELACFAWENQIFDAEENH